MPSMVRTLEPCGTFFILTMQPRTILSFRITEQAPHCPSLQVALQPVSMSWLRSTSASSCPPSATMYLSRPLTLSVTLCIAYLSSFKKKEWDPCDSVGPSQSASFSKRTARVATDVALEAQAAVPEPGDVASAHLLSGQDSWEDQVEDRGLVVHGATGDAQHRDGPDVSQHEHRAGEHRSPVHPHIPTGGPDGGRCDVVRVDGHAPRRQ